MLKMAILGDGNGVRGLNTRMALQEKIAEDTVETLQGLGKNLGRVAWMLFSTFLTVVADIVLRALHHT